MIRTITENGVSVVAEFVDDSNEVTRLLQAWFSKKALKEIYQALKRSQEIIFSTVVGRKDELPMVRYTTFHLDNLHKQHHCIFFHVHKDHVDAAEKLSKGFMSHVKNLNNWDETTRIPMKLELNPILARKRP